jgi:hypothetical protein
VLTFGRGSTFGFQVASKNKQGLKRQAQEAATALCDAATKSHTQKRESTKEAGAVAANLRRWQ